MARGGPPDAQGTTFAWILPSNQGHIFISFFGCSFLLITLTLHQALHYPPHGSSASDCFLRCPSGQASTISSGWRTTILRVVSPPPLIPPYPFCSLLSRCGALKVTFSVSNILFSFQNLDNMSSNLTENSFFLKFPSMTLVSQGAVSSDCWQVP